MSKSTSSVAIRVVVFWVVLISFFVWDWCGSEPINLRHESAIIAVGSGKAPSGGHCATF